MTGMVNFFTPSDDVRHILSLLRSVWRAELGLSCGVMSRLRRLVGCARFFITCRLLPHRGRLSEREFEEEPQSPNTRDSVLPALERFCGSCQSLAGSVNTQDRCANHAKRRAAREEMRQVQMVGANTQGARGYLKGPEDIPESTLRRQDRNGPAAGRRGQKSRRALAGLSRAIGSNAPIRGKVPSETTVGTSLFVGPNGLR